MIRRLVLLSLIFLPQCTELLVVQVGDCEFYVSDDSPLTLTADTVRYCAGYLRVSVVEFPLAGERAEK